MIPAMRKLTKAQFCTSSLAALVLAALWSASFCFAQAPPSPNSPSTESLGNPANVSAASIMPTDPKELMRIASKANGLTRDDARPWHLRATYSLLDEKGNVTDHGTYEEFWAGPTKFKRTFTGGGFHQTDFGTEKGVYRLGQRAAIPLLVFDIRRDFVTPAPSPEAADHSTFTLQTIDAKGTKLSCLRFATLPDPGLVYCLPPDRPIVVINTYLGESIQVIHDRILDFHSRFIAGDLHFIRAGKPLLDAHLESLETLKPSDEANLAPPAEAVLLPRRVNISGGVAQGMILKHSAPTYPRTALDARVSGTVVLEATIGTDGYITDLQVVSGPPMLRQSALDAVQTWTYRPYLLNGDPVEVRTTINVVFTLGG
jgi:TonB family protein